MKILVIDDDPAILELVSQYLSLSAQHEVRSESSARDALAAIDEPGAAFDCFLVDIQMPGVDGITFVEFIRERDDYRHTPIVMLTAMEDKDHVDRAFSAGATDYVTKPFDFYDLQIRIHAAQSAAQAKRDAGAPGTGLAVQADLALGDPISLPEVEAALDYGEFENYVRQLLNRRLYRISAIAVKIGGIELIHQHFTPAEFRAVIHDVAIEVKGALLAVGGILTYRGNGVFLCVPDRRLQGRRNAMQKALNKRHRVTHPTLGRIPSSLYVGDQVSLGSSTAVDVLASLELAVESVEKQAPGPSERMDNPKPPIKSDRLLDGAGSWGRGAGEPLA